MAWKFPLKTEFREVRKPHESFSESASECPGRVKKNKRRKDQISFKPHLIESKGTCVQIKREEGLASRLVDFREL